MYIESVSSTGSDKRINAAFISLMLMVEESVQLPRLQYKLTVYHFHI